MLLHIAIIQPPQSHALDDLPHCTKRGGDAAADNGYPLALSLLYIHSCLKVFFFYIEVRSAVSLQQQTFKISSPTEEATFSWGDERPREGGIIRMDGLLPPNWLSCHWSNYSKVTGWILLPWGTAPGCSLLFIQCNCQLSHLPRLSVETLQLLTLYAGALAPWLVS